MESATISKWVSNFLVKKIVGCFAAVTSSLKNKNRVGLGFWIFQRRRRCVLHVQKGRRKNLIRKKWVIRSFFRITP